MNIDLKDGKRYIMSNLVTAVPMTKNEYRSYLKGANATLMNISSAVKDLLSMDGCFEKEGYAVNISGDIHWIPKNIFEAMTIELQDNKDLPSDININETMVDNFIVTNDTVTLGNKTTVVRATLRNGFEIVESSGCVDEMNYDTMVGEGVCINKIKKKVWDYLGFLLQTAWKGIH